MLSYFSTYSTLEIETFFIPWDQILYPVSQKSAAWDWNHCDTHLRLSVILKTRTLTGRNFLRRMKRWKSQGARFWLKVGWWLNTSQPNSCRRCVDSYVEPYVAIGLAQLTMISIDALCIQKLYHRPDFTVGTYWNKSLLLQPLQRCYNENSGSHASACVMRRH